MKKKDYNRRIAQVALGKGRVVQPILGEGSVEFHLVPGRPGCYDRGSNPHGGDLRGSEHGKQEQKHGPS